MRSYISAVILALLAGSVQAGDWTGSYAGAQLGLRPGNAGVGGDELRFGLHGGYNVDFGGLVLGGEVEFERMRLVESNGAEVLSNVGRLKLRAGRDFGATMAYAIVGGVNGDSATGNDFGVVYGLGVLTAVGDHLMLSGEALRQVFDEFGTSGADLKTNSFNVRVSFRF